MNMKDMSLKDAVIIAYRHSLQTRYSLENIRRFPSLKDFPSDSIADIRSFFLDSLYPAPEERAVLDRAFDQLGLVMKSPFKMLRLAGVAGRSLFKLNGHFTAAATAGFRTLETFIHLRRIENLVEIEAHRSNIFSDALQTEEVFDRLMAQLPESYLIGFRRDLLTLFKALSDTALLQTTLEILGDSEEVMMRSPTLFSKDDIHGLRQGREILKAGHRLYEKLSDEERMLALRGIEEVEKDWHNTILNRYTAA